MTPTPETKPWFQSITLWGAIIAAVAVVLNAAGVPVSDEEQRSAAELLTHAGEAVGLGLVIWGRFRARHTLTVSGGTGGIGTGIALALAISGTLTIAACAGTKLSDARVQLLTACESWTNVLTAAAGWRAAGTLTESSIDNIEHWRKVVEPICKEPAPTEIAASGGLGVVERALQQVLAIQPKTERRT
ncbi:MAG: hypothetical protein ABTQ30_15095 [Rhizobiaceae bacterium]